jgi:hypothetical protein
MARGGSSDTGHVEVPDLVGMIVADARRKGHEAGLVVVSADPDGPPLGGLTWLGTWIVTAQHPAPGVRLKRWDNVVIEFEELRGGEGAGDRSHASRCQTQECWLPNWNHRPSPGSRDPAIPRPSSSTEVTLTRSAAGEGG